MNRWALLLVLLLAACERRPEFPCYAEQDRIRCHPLNTSDKAGVVCAEVKVSKGASVVFTKQVCTGTIPPKFGVDQVEYTGTQCGPKGEECSVVTSNETFRAAE